MDIDALLIVSFGGPEGMADVMPFLANVLRGRNVPAERMRAVAKHYELFAGVSPINEQNRNLIAALQKEMAANGLSLPIYWGNRNWHPMLADTLAEMAADGIKNALAFVTAAYSSYSSCRQYLENIAEARDRVGSSAPQIAKLRAFYNHPLFIEANVDRLQAAMITIPEARRSATQIAFTAHSIPRSMADNCQYESQLLETGRLVSLGANRESWRLVYQSRSGPPTQPWLGPDILDHLKELKDSGATDVVIAPIGFVSDHMEIIYDLDTEARQFCDQTGLNMVRAATVGTHPLFIRMIRELIQERIDPRSAPRFLGSLGANNDLCFAGCCLPKV
ncbi:MAG: ferrochelatase [Pyrinomonadaceae bacterium]|nr:ferrochelatase [Pyrinomonadaceae bacterium]